MKTTKRISAIALVVSLLLSCAVFPANAVIKREITIAEGTQEQLPVYPRYYDEYTLGDSSIAQFDFDEVYGLKPGTTTLSFLGMDGEEYEYTVKVTPAPSSIKLNCKTKTIYTGKSFKLKFTLSAGSTGRVWFSSSNNDVAYVDYDGAKSKSYKWKSSNKKVVSVKGKGKSAAIITSSPTTSSKPISIHFIGN